MSVTHPSEGSSNPSSPSSTQNNFNYQAALSNNAPKYGTVVPKRVFVGGINSTTTEDELCELFSNYGLVKQVKIVVDRGGISKGYGFVTFDSEEEAKRLQKDSDNVIFKEKRLNIAPAIKKQGFTGTYDSLPTVTSPVPPAPISNMYYHNGLPFTYHNGMAYFPSNGQPMVPTSPPTVSSQQETAVYPQPTYAPPPSHVSNQTSAYGAPLVYVQPAPVFMPTQQYQYSAMPVAAPNTASYIYASPGPPPIAPTNGGPADGLQYQVYQPPVLPNDMYYAAAAATAPMYSMPMFVNYDAAAAGAGFYSPYSLEAAAGHASGGCGGLDASSNSNYSEDDASHYSNNPAPVSSLGESAAHHPETPVVSLLKLQESHPEERELTAFRRPAPTAAPHHHKSNNNNNSSYHPASHVVHHSDSPALVYYPSNVYATPPSGVNNVYLYPHGAPHKPNFRGGFSSARQKAPQRALAPHKHVRPAHHNNNTYDHYCGAKHAPAPGAPAPGTTPPPVADHRGAAHDSPKRSVSPPPPPYSPMIQPLFINGESPYSFSPPAPHQMAPAHPPLPAPYAPAALGPPRSYQALNHGAPRRVNPRVNEKTSTGPKNFARTGGNGSRGFSILNKHHPAPPLPDGSGDAPSLPTVDVDPVSYQLHNYVL